MKEFEKYFLISDFEEGWGMEEVVCDEHLIDYCIEVLYIPEEKIEELSMMDSGLEIFLSDIELEDISDDWYVNLVKKSKDS